MSNGNTKNHVHSTGMIGGNTESEDSKYRGLLEEHGIKKKRNEALTREDLRRIFVYMQEDTCIGM